MSALRAIRSTAVAVAALAALVTAARAQDAIEALLKTPAPAGSPAPAAPATAPAPAQDPPGPVTQTPDQAEVQPEGPPNESALAYEARIRQSVASAQALQGPMDGRWTLYGEDGAALYVFQFVDPSNGVGPLEAAWRDPRRVRGVDDLGVVDVVGRDGPTLTLTFAPAPGARMVRVQLQAGTTGGFAGKLDDGAGAARGVTLRR